MGRAWVKRWSPKPPTGRGNLVPCLTIHPKTSIERIDWDLPPSKSHAIRALALAAQCEGVTVIHGLEHAGQDVVSMRRCLAQLGVRCTDLDASGQPMALDSNADHQPPPGSMSWSVQGVGVSGFRQPSSVLHAGNSGTALRFLMALCARLQGPVMLDGDATLRSRAYPVMFASLAQMGLDLSYGVEEEGLPLLMKGPWKVPQTLAMDATHSSQPLSAWKIASAAFPHPVRIELAGEAVSREHRRLTWKMAQEFGCDEATDSLTLIPWTPRAGTDVHIPVDASMLAFPMLTVIATGTTVTLPQLPSHSHSLGHDILLECAADLGVIVHDSTLTRGKSELNPLELDLRDGNDLITPLAAMMALGGGGTIDGVAHAAHKESNRLQGTVNLLEQFGLMATVKDAVVRVPGHQTITTPKAPVQTWGDHRMQMTALVLALACDDEVAVVGDRLHEVADPDAVARWQRVGVSISATLLDSS